MSTNPLHSSFVLSIEAQPESNGFLHDIAEFLWGIFLGDEKKVRSVGGVFLSFFYLWMSLIVCVHGEPIILDFIII